MSEAIQGNQYITEMLCACILLILPCRKRKHSCLRIIAFSLLVEIGSFLVMGSDSAKLIWENAEYTVVSSIVYVVTFTILALVFIAFCCPVKGRELVYCTTLAFCVEHFFSSFWLLMEEIVPWESSFSYILGEMAAGLIIYFLFYEYCVKRICENGVYQADNQQMMLATCLIYLIVAFTSIFVKGINVKRESLLFWFCQIYEMLCCWFLMWIQVNQKEALKLQRELDIQSYLQHLRHEQFQRSNQNMKSMRHLMHELAHQLSDMLTEKNNEMRENLLEEIGKKLLIYEGDFQTNNEILNTALMEWQLCCRERQIMMTCVADCEMLSVFETGDLYLILHNALDNAIEAVSKLDNVDERLVDIKIFTRDSFLFLQFENRYRGNLRFYKGLPHTTRGEDGNHGFGLKSIRYIAEKYDGDISVRAKDNWFSLKVLIPLNKE